MTDSLDYLQKGKTLLETKFATPASDYLLISIAESLKQIEKNTTPPSAHQPQTQKCPGLLNAAMNEEITARGDAVFLASYASNQIEIPESWLGHIRRATEENKVPEITVLSRCVEQLDYVRELLTGERR